MAGLRTGHYLKPNLSGHTPACVVAVLVEGSVRPDYPESSAVTRTGFGRVHVVASRRDHAKWAAPTHKTFEAVEAFWAWLETWTFSKRKAYLFAPVASDALTLLDFWKRVDDLGGRFKSAGQDALPDGIRPRRHAAFVFDRLVLRGVPDIVEYRFNAKSYLWLSGHQYFNFTDDVLAKTVGFVRDAQEESGVIRGATTWTAPERARLWHHAARTLGEWWGSLNAGGWGRTVGTMAVQFLRSRLPAKAVATHTDDRVIRLERLACHGGRASTWYYGDVIHRHHTPGEQDLPFKPSARWRAGETLFHVDVASMYPWIMANTDLPTKLVSYTTEMDPKGLAALMRGYAAVAYVTVRTECPEYPHRRDGFVVYPVGTFRTTLCGAELARALDSGEVVRVHQAALYKRGRPFAAAASELLRFRTDARTRGNTGWEAFVKLLSNSLTGKLAQRSAQWLPRPKIHGEHQWGEWLQVKDGDDAPTRFRALAGMVWELSREAGGTGLLTACYAHITAAGRDHMRLLRAACPPRSVYSQDTDGLWVTRAATEALAIGRTTAPTGAGALRLVESSTCTRFHSPKHYYAAGRWVLAGLHNPTPVAADLSCSDHWTDNPIRRSCDAPPSLVDHHARTITLSTIPHDGVIGEDGWATPLELPLRLKPPTPTADGKTPNPQPELEWDAA